MRREGVWNDVVIVAETKELLCAVRTITGVEVDAIYQVDALL